MFFFLLDECEALSLALVEEHCLWVFLSRVMMTNIRPKWKEKQELENS
jgi:hypothetical protein